MGTQVKRYTGSKLNNNDWNQNADALQEVQDVLGGATDPVNGILKGNGDSPVTAAVAGTDYVAPDEDGFISSATVEVRPETVDSYSPDRLATVQHVADRARMMGRKAITGVEKYYSFPSTVTLPSGRIIMIFGRPTSHWQGDSSIWWCHSDDGGITWSVATELIPTVYANGGNTWRGANEPNLLVMSDGEHILLTYSIVLAHDIDPSATFHLSYEEYYCASKMGVIGANDTITWGPTSEVHAADVASGWGVDAPQMAIELPNGDIYWPLYTIERQMEKQTVRITGTPTGGTFTISYNSGVTAAIPYNATAAQVVAALEGLTFFEPGDITATGGPLPGADIVLTFVGRVSGTDLFPLGANGAGLTGGSSPAATIIQVQSNAISGFDSIAIRSVKPVDGWNITDPLAWGSKDVIASIAGRRLAEPRLIQLDDGNILASIRDEGPAGAYLQHMFRLIGVYNSTTGVVTWPADTAAAAAGQYIPMTGRVWIHKLSDGRLAIFGRSFSVQRLTASSTGYPAYYVVPADGDYSKAGIERHYDSDVKSTGWLGTSVVEVAPGLLGIAYGLEYGHNAGSARIWWKYIPENEVLDDYGSENMRDTVSATGRFGIAHAAGVLTIGGGSGEWGAGASQYANVAFATSLFNHVGWNSTTKTGGWVANVIGNVARYPAVGNALFTMNPLSSHTGGVQFNGYTNGDANSAIMLGGHMGHVSPTNNPAIILEGWKWNGSDNRVAMSGTERIFAIRPGREATIFEVLANGQIKTTLPTFADNASATVAVGVLYKTATGEVRVKV